MGKVISLHAGIGGMGKTSLTAGLALNFARSGSRVLCVDCQAGFGTLDLYLGMESMDTLSYADICRGDYPLGCASTHPDFSNLFYIAAPVRSAYRELDEQAFQNMIQRAKTAYDYVLLNAPAGLGEMALLAAEFADQCLLVCGMDPATIRSSSRVADQLQLMGKIDSRLVVGRMDPALMKSMKKTVDDIVDQVGVPLLGLVPEDPQILLLTTAGEFQKGKKWAFAAYERICKRMQGQPVPIPTR